jgi:hypothetical protein
MEMGEGLERLFARGFGLEGERLARQALLDAQESPAAPFRSARGLFRASAGAARQSADAHGPGLFGRERPLPGPNLARRASARLREELGASHGV